MHLFLSSILRPLVWSVIAISAIAVGLGRAAPRTIPYQHQAVPRYHGINGRYFSIDENFPRFLDRETGRFLRVECPAGDMLDNVVCSPWCDERGQYQVVGRWLSSSGEGNSLLPQQFGVARYTLPEGRVIDRVELDMTPGGTPCWVPGLSPRIVFAGGDGQLYHYAFGEANGAAALEDGAADPARPQRLTWRTTPPGVGPIFFKDLVWPSDPRMGGRLIASLSYQIQTEGKRYYVDSQLWWIQLSGDGMDIEAVGRLIVPDGPGPIADPDDEERHPNLESSPEGGLVLAYLSRARPHKPWVLRVAPVALAPGTGMPIVRRGSSRAVAGQCVAIPPVFSADGRWVYGSLGTEPEMARIVTRRFSVAGILAQSSPYGPGRQGRPGSTRPGRSDLAWFVTSRLVAGRARHHARH